MVELSRSRGFSLIELMITVAIIGLLATMAISFTGAWTINSQLQTAKGNLVQAHAYAKAGALRGQGGWIAWSEEDGRQVAYACKGTEDTCEQGSEDLLWSAKNPPGVNIELYAGDSLLKSPLKLDARGRPINENGEYLSDSLFFALSKGGESNALFIH